MTRSPKPELGILTMTPVAYRLVQIHHGSLAGPVDRYELEGRFIGPDRPDGTTYRNEWRLIETIRRVEK